MESGGFGSPSAGFDCFSSYSTFVVAYPLLSEYNIPVHEGTVPQNVGLGGFYFFQTRNLMAKLKLPRSGKSVG